MSKVIMDCVLRLWCLDGDISPQKHAVIKGDCTGSINTYYVLVKLVDLNDNACLVPPFWDANLSDFEFAHGGQL